MTRGSRAAPSGRRERVSQRQHVTDPPLPARWTGTAARRRVAARSVAGVAGAAVGRARGAPSRRVDRTVWSRWLRVGSLLSTKLGLLPLRQPLAGLGVRPSSRRLATADVAVNASGLVRRGEESTEVASGERGALADLDRDVHAPVLVAVDGAPYFVGVSLQGHRDLAGSTWLEGGLGVDPRALDSQVVREVPLVRHVEGVRAGREGGGG
jgi:hypothetical protein